jgi:hypothetical protein
MLFGVVGFVMKNYTKKYLNISVKLKTNGENYGTKARRNNQT